MKRILALVAAACCIVAAPVGAQQPTPEVSVMPIESMDDFMAWFKAPKGSYPRLQEAVPGKKVWFPIVVTGLRPPQHGEVRLVADFEMLGPDGKSIATQAACCSYTITDRPDIISAVLGHTMNVEFDPHDPKGVYTVRVTVHDGTRVVNASNTVRLGGPAAADARPAAEMRTGTHLALPDAKTESASQQPTKEVPPGPKRTFRHADRTACLDLPTPEEVIRCSEQK